MRGLDEKIAVWRFPNAESVQVLASVIHIYHEATKDPDYPWVVEKFTKSLDACFEWVAPALLTLLGYQDYYKFLIRWCSSDEMVEGGEAIAFCVAAEKLIDSEGKANA